MMKIYLDSANLADIRQACLTGVISGITINQALLAKELPSDPTALFTKIGTYLDCDEHLSVPVLSDAPDDMFNIGVKLADELGYDELALKVPVSWPTLSVINSIANAGYTVNATCIYSMQQAEMAYRAGATILSAFVGRMNDVQPELGYHTLAAIKKKFPEAIVLAGSVRNTEMVRRVEDCGADIVTVSKTVLENMATEVHSTLTAEQFQDEYQRWMTRQVQAAA